MPKPKSGKPGETLETRGRPALIPIDRLGVAAWNPKDPLFGPPGSKPRPGRDARAEGLGGSIDRFGFCDELKVWPDPSKPGHFVVIDGNQRLELFGRKGVKEVSCRVLDHLTLAEAKAFTAAFDRNSARFDEAKQAALAAELGPDWDALLRPDPTLAGAPAADEDEPDPIDPADLPGPGHDDDAPPAPAVVPRVFTLTADLSARLDAALPGARSRLGLAKRLVEAVEALADPAASIDDDLAAEAGLALLAAKAEARAAKKAKGGGGR